MLDRIELGGFAVQQRRECLVERLVRGADALDQNAKVILIGVQRLCFGGEFLNQVLPRALR